MCLAAALSLCGVGLAGCEYDGVAEEAGETIDEAAEDVSDAVDDVVDDVEDAG